VSYLKIGAILLSEKMSSEKKTNIITKINTFFAMLRIKKKNIIVKDSLLVSESKILEKLL